MPSWQECFWNSWMPNQKFIFFPKNTKAPSKPGLRLQYAILSMNTSNSSYWIIHDSDKETPNFLRSEYRPQEKSRIKPIKSERIPREKYYLLLLLLGFRAEHFLDRAEPLALLPHGSAPRSSKQSHWRGTSKSPDGPDLYLSDPTPDDDKETTVAYTHKRDATLVDE